MTAQDPAGLDLMSLFLWCRYQAEDEDELSLELGDVVQVIEYEDPEEQVFQSTFISHSSPIHRSL